jgi:hypothetical protein
MSPAPGNKLSDLPVAEAALRELCMPFLADPAAFRPEVVVVQPDEIPYPQDQLLVHHEHMTEVLQRHHGSPVEVTVLEEHGGDAGGGPLYTRKISLAPRNAPDKVVEWGIVRLDFRYMAAEVRDEILAKQLPLGAVLIKHDVLRRIKPRWFIRCPATGPLLRLFGRPSTPDDVYGRIGTIYCNDEPAIELIEIVLNCDNGQPRKTNGHAI